MRITHDASRISSLVCRGRRCGCSRHHRRRATISGCGFLRRRRQLAQARVIEQWVAEAVHTQSPLITNEGSLDARQQPKADQDGSRHPDRELNPRRRRVELLKYKDTGDDHVGGDCHHEVGWRIVGALVKQFGAALRAEVVDLQILPIERALAAGSTLLMPAALYRLPDVPGRKLLSARAISWV